MLNEITGITNAVSGFVFVLSYARMLGIVSMVCGLFFDVDNFNNHHRDYFSNGSGFLNVCNVPRDLQLVTNNFNAFSGNSIADRKL